MEKLKTFEELEIEETLAYKLDLELYLPVKEELAGKGITHHLGMRKEGFKGTVAEELAKIKKEAIKWVKHWLNTLGDPKFLIDKKHCVGFRKEDMDRFNITQCEACASIGAFVNFFNIIEEELLDLNQRGNK